MTAIEKQKNAAAYDDFSYDYTLLKPFMQKNDMQCNDNGNILAIKRHTSDSKGTSPWQSFRKQNNRSSDRMSSASARPERQNILKRNQSTYM